MARTSSAVPTRLHHYSRDGLEADSALWMKASSLQTALQRFEACCREYPVSVGHHADDLRQFSNRSLDLDWLAKRTAEGFERADVAARLGLPTMPALPVIWKGSIRIRIPEWSFRFRYRNMDYRWALWFTLAAAERAVWLIRRLRLMLWWLGARRWGRIILPFVPPGFSGVLWPPRLLPPTGTRPWGPALWPPRFAQWVGQVALLIADAVGRIVGGRREEPAESVGDVIVEPVPGPFPPEDEKEKPRPQNDLPDSMKVIADTWMGHYVDVDKAYGSQCVDFVRLMRPDLPAGKGYAKNYLDMATKINGHGQPLPQPGAVLVWAANAGAGKEKAGSAGHVAIVESVNPDGTVNVIEQNWPEGSRVKRRPNVKLTEGMGFIPYKGPAEQPSKEADEGQRQAGQGSIPRWPTDTVVDSDLLGFGCTYASGKYKGQRHPGFDIGGDKGTPVRPIGPGKVVKVRDDKGGYGHYVVVEHTLDNGTKVYSLYAHLEEKPKVDVGASVDSSTVLGGMGASGGGSGGVVHLHLEMRTQAGYEPWKEYKAAGNSDWRDYWLDPGEVIGNPEYAISPVKADPSLQGT